MTSQNLDQPSQPIRPSDLAEIEKLPPAIQAQILTARAQFIDAMDRMSYAEKGCLAEYVERTELWKLVDLPGGKRCGSQNEWIEVFCPFSRATWFDAKRRWKELSDVPAEDRIQIPRGNIVEMQKLSTAVRKDPEVIEAAKTLPPNQFIHLVDQLHPGQHLKAPDIMDDAVKLAMRLGAETKTEARDEIAGFYIDEHRQDYDGMMMEETA
jgi:hypothetical protein